MGWKIGDKFLIDVDRMNADPLIQSLPRYYPSMYDRHRNVVYVVTGTAKYGQILIHEREDGKAEPGAGNAIDSDYCIKLDHRRPR